MTYSVYTDGSCLGNPGKGGIGIVIYKDDKQVNCIMKGYENTTNNRMELMAVIYAIESLTGEKISIFTDSKYLKNGIEKWIHNWKKNGWKTATKKNVKNKDLWVKLDEIKTDDISFNWVMAHSGIPQNEMADKLAKEGAMSDFLEKDKGYNE